MNSLIGDAAAIVVAANVTALPFPPTSIGYVPSHLRDQSRGAIPKLDIEIWSNSTINLTAAELWAGTQQPLVFADNDVTSVDHTVDTFTKVAHGFLTGDGPVRFTNSGGALPPEVVVDTDYWIIWLTANTYKIAESFAAALAGTAIALTGNGTGTHTVVDTPTTERLHWHTCGLLGVAADGAVALTNQKSSLNRVKHHTRIMAYAVSATLSAASALWASMYPVIEK